MKQKIEVFGPENQVNIAKFMMNQMIVVTEMLQEDEIGFLLNDWVKTVNISQNNLHW